MDSKYEALADIENDLEFIKHRNILPDISQVASHYHDGMEILCFLDGFGSVYLNGKKLNIKKGDTVVVNSKEIHSIVPDTDLKYYCIILKKSFLKKHNFPYKESYIKSQFSDEKITEYCSYICEEENEKSQWYKKQAYAYLILLTVQLYSEHLYKNKKNLKSSIPSKTALVISMMDYISDNCEKVFSLEELELALGYSKYYLCRTFKELTTQTIIEYINRLKCSKAMEDLKSGEYAVYEIAQKYGYDNFSYFSETFKKYIGKSPSSVSKNNGN